MGLDKKIEISLFDLILLIVVIFGFLIVLYLLMDHYADIKYESGLNHGKQVEISEIINLTLNNKSINFYNDDVNITLINKNELVLLEDKIFSNIYDSIKKKGMVNLNYNNQSLILVEYSNN